MEANSIADLRNKVEYINMISNVTVNFFVEYEDTRKRCREQRKCT